MKCDKNTDDGIQIVNAVIVGVGLLFFVLFITGTITDDNSKYKYMVKYTTGDYEHKTYTKHYKIENGCATLDESVVCGNFKITRNKNYKNYNKKD